MYKVNLEHDQQHNEHKTISATTTTQWAQDDLRHHHPLSRLTLRWRLRFRLWLWLHYDQQPRLHYDRHYGHDYHDCKVDETLMQVDNSVAGVIGAYSRDNGMEVEKKGIGIGKWIKDLYSEIHNKFS